MADGGMKHNAALSCFNLIFVGADLGHTSRRFMHVPTEHIDAEV